METAANTIREIIFNGPLEYNKKRECSRSYEVHEVKEILSSNVQIYGECNIVGEEFAEKFSQILLALSKATQTGKCVLFTGHGLTFSIYLKDQNIYVCDTHKVLNYNSGMLARCSAKKPNGSLEALCKEVGDLVENRIYQSVGFRVHTETTQLVVVGRPEIPELVSFRMEGYMASADAASPKRKSHEGSVEDHQSQSTSDRQHTPSSPEIESSNLRLSLESSEEAQEALNMQSPTGEKTFTQNIENQPDQNSTRVVLTPPPPFDQSRDELQKEIKNVLLNQERTINIVQQVLAIPQLKGL